MLTALSLPSSNYSSPFKQCPFRASFFFCPQILSYPCFSLLFPVTAHHGFPTVLCTCVTTHVTAGVCLCFVRRFQFPYITLWILVPFDFGLHGLFAWVWILESNNNLTEPGGNCASHSALSWLRFRRCLRWMTIGLTTLLVPLGKYVCVCVFHYLWWVQESGS